MIKLNNVSCNYGEIKAINSISCEINGGENICIVGPNGCGKSTLLKSIVGLTEYTGEIEIDNKKLKDYTRKEVAIKISFLSQITSVYFSYTVYETVMLGRYSKIKNSMFGSTTNSDKEYVVKCLKAVNVYHLKDRAITELSGGELQRVFLAKVFAQDPKIIILDEPTNHLDLKNQIELMDYLKAWSKGTDKIVIAVLHDINLAISFADKILLLSEGELVSFQNKEEILKSNLLNEVYNLDIKQYMKKSFEQWNS